MANEHKKVRNYQQTARTWYLFAFTLEVLKKERLEIENQESAYKMAAINASIILHIATIVEGSVRALLISKIEKNEVYEDARSSNNAEILTLLNEHINQIGKSAWKILSEQIAMNVLGYNLLELYPKKDREWLQSLFEFRNLLAHGGTMSHKKDFHIQISESGERKKEIVRDDLTKEKLFNFLADKKLIPKKGDRTLLQWNFLNSKVSDTFLYHAKEFLKALYMKIEKDQGLPYSFKDDIGVIQNL